MIGYLGVKSSFWNLWRDIPAGLPLVFNGTFLVAKAIQVNT